MADVIHINTDLRGGRAKPGPWYGAIEDWDRRPPHGSGTRQAVPGRLYAGRAVGDSSTAGLGCGLGFTRAKGVKCPRARTMCARPGVVTRFR